VDLRELRGEDKGRDVEVSHCLVWRVTLV
jgi:hypothetical protein